MKVEGLDKFNKVLDNSQKNFKSEASKRLDLIAHKLVGITKRKTPVDTGHLRRNWASKKLSDTERLVFNNTKYARFVEYGHRTKNGKVVEGRYMLTKSMKEIEKDLDKEFSIMLENLWK